MDDFSINEWVIVKFKSNQELGTIDSIYFDTNTARINLNPYKFNKVTTIENLKNVTKLGDAQKERLKSLVEDINILERKLASLKGQIAEL